MASRRERLRRVITGVDREEKSYVAYDGRPGPAIEYGEGAGLYEIWTDRGDPLDRSAPVEDADRVQLSPPAGGVKIRWFTIAPDREGASRVNSESAYRELFATIRADHDRPDTSRHPGMHLTQTLDYIVVIEGRVRLMLDKDERVLGPGDVVVQRGTNHAWICDGGEPALMVAVLIDKEFSR